MTASLKLTSRQLCRPEELPYERRQDALNPRTAAVAFVALSLLSLLEISAHQWKSTVGVVASRVWFFHGALALGWLLWASASTAWSDLKRGRVWFVVPILLGVPLCFFNVGGFAELNSEALSELQHAFEKLALPDWGYTDMFWVSYPSRSLLLNLVPTLVTGISPEAYRLGFSIPVFLGTAFFCAGLRRYYEAHPFAAPLAGLGTGAIFTYPIACSVTRTFEMAVSSMAFGLWALAALLLFASRPSFVSALAVAWTTGLLAASFTSGLALVAFIWVWLFAWVFRTALRGQRTVGALVSGVLLYAVVVGVGLYLSRPRALQPQPIDLARMLENFWRGLQMVASIDQTVFTAPIMVLPTLAAAGLAVSLRVGLLPLGCVLWCFPTIWSTVNLQGKIAPQLPFVLYRAIVIVPVIVYVVVRLGAWLSAPSESGARAWRSMFLACAVGLGVSAHGTYRSLNVFAAQRPPYHSEAVVRDLVEALPRLGLTPFSNAVLLDQTGAYEMHRIPAFGQYFLPGWTRANANEPLFFDNPSERRPGVVFVRPGDPLITKRPEGYAVETQALMVPTDSQHTLDIVRLVYRPTSGG